MNIKKVKKKTCIYEKNEYNRTNEMQFEWNPILILPRVKMNSNIVNDDNKYNMNMSKKENNTNNDKCSG